MEMTRKLGDSEGCPRCCETPKREKEPMGKEGRKESRQEGRKEGHEGGTRVVTEADRHRLIYF